MSLYTGVQSKVCWYLKVSHYSPKQSHYAQLRSHLFGCYYAQNYAGIIYQLRVHKLHCRVLTKCTIVYNLSPWIEFE